MNWWLTIYKFECVAPVQWNNWTQFNKQVNTNSLQRLQRYMPKNVDHFRQSERIEMPNIVFCVSMNVVNHFVKAINFCAGIMLLTTTVIWTAFCFPIKINAREWFLLFIQRFFNRISMRLSRAIYCKNWIFKNHAGIKKNDSRKYFHLLSSSLFYLSIVRVHWK